MLKKVLNLKDVQELSNSNLKTIKGGRATGNFPYYCWDKDGDFDSSIDVSGGGVHCTPVAVVSPSAPGSKTRA